MLTLTRREWDFYVKTQSKNKAKEQPRTKQNKNPWPYTTWKVFLRAFVEPEMSQFNFICFWFQKGRKVKASLF